MPRFFIYCRKSSEDDDRQILSVDSQLSELSRLAQQRGFSVGAVFTESRSAKQPGRPVFTSMMERIRHHDAQGIICWKLDRLARNPIDGGAVIWAMQEQQLQIVTPTQTFSKAADNTLLMYLEFGMAHKFIEDLSRNVIRGLRTKAELGWRPSGAKVGYMNNSFKEKGQKDIGIDPERFPLVRQMWELLLSGGYTVPQIVDIANNQWGFRTRAMKKIGGKPLAQSTLYEAFTDTFYYGWFEYPRGSGRWYQGKHQPMITEAEYDQAQVTLGRKGKPRPIRHVFAFTGLIRCGECGRMITAEEKQHLVCSVCRHKFSCRHQERCPRCQVAIDDMTAPIRRQYTYYHCTKKNSPNCGQRVVTRAELEAQILAFLARVDMSDRSHRWAVKALDEVRTEKLKGLVPIEGTRRRGVQDYQQQLDNLTRLYTSPRNADRSLLSDEEYERQRFVFLKEKSTLADDPASQRDQMIRQVESVAKTLNFAREIREQFKDGDAKKKRAILAGVGSNLSLKDKKLSFEPHIPFRVIERDLRWLRRFEPVIEPPSDGFNAGEFGTSKRAIPTLSGRPIDVRTYKRRWRKLVLKILESFESDQGNTLDTLAA
ncbi:MAG: recombinase family protein [Deltaproteobacteria bacterium]|nr:recombinase family protein [Deltaproteobacteria bacterium]MBI3390320.1 recombinase family protein [Deltaproteobacteria bacterium]